MVEQTLPELDVDAVGRMRQCIGAQELQEHVEEADQHEAHDQHE